MIPWYARGRTGEQVLDAIEMMIDAKDKYDYDWGLGRLYRIGLTEEEVHDLLVEEDLLL